jgi:hypothetical protein
VFANFQILMRMRVRWNGEDYWRRFELS